LEDQGVLDDQGFLDEQATLRQITQVATELVRAKYGALAVLGQHGIEQFIRVGMDDSVVAGMPHPPVGRGIPGLVVPLVIRGAVFGNLYLAEKEGGESFSENDERIVTIIAAAAIENARVFERTRRREQWQQLVTRMGSVVLSGGTAQDAAELLAEGARELLKASGAAVVLQDSADLQRAADGDGVAESLLPTVTLRARDRIIGVLTLERAATEPPVAEADLELAQPFLEQAAVTLVLAKAQREHERLAVFEDRDRIARDLHDLVIQRLFATGMLLEGALRSMADSPAVARVSTAVDQLDLTVKEIRQTIFALHEPMDGSGGALRGRIMHEVSQAKSVLGFSPTVRFTGTIDTSASTQISDQAVAAVRELLTNVGKHAKATQVEVAAAIVDHQLIVTVMDDGVGTHQGVRSSGLANLQARAVEMGGGFEITAGEHATGTTARWYVPLTTPVS